MHGAATAEQTERNNAQSGQFPCRCPLPRRRQSSGHGWSSFPRRLCTQMERAAILVARNVCFLERRRWWSDMQTVVHWKWVVCFCVDFDPFHFVLFWTIDTEDCTSFQNNYEVNRGKSDCSCSHKIQRIREQIANLQTEIAKMKYKDMNLLESHMGELKRELDFVAASYMSEKEMLIPLTDKVRSWKCFMF